MNWLYRVALKVNQFMAGRHGTDQLTLALMVAYFIITFLANLTRIPLLMLLGLLVLAWAFYRILSKNLWHRQRENEVFLKYWRRIFGWFRGSSQRFNRWQQRKTDQIRDKQFHRYYKCPKCKKTLRVPRGKGKIMITCPVCGTEFVKKT